MLLESSSVRNHIDYYYSTSSKDLMFRTVRNLPRARRSPCCLEALISAQAQVDLPSYFPKGSHIWLVPRSETSEFSNYFGFRPTFEAYDNKTSNGDWGLDEREPVALFRRGGVVDTFGVARAEWADQDWVKVPKNGWAYRDSTSMTPSGSGFDSNSKYSAKIKTQAPPRDSSRESV